MSSVFCFIKKCFTSYLRLALLAALPLVAIVSWICSMYYYGSVNSLLDADGIRWSISNMVTNLYDAPVVNTLIFLICTSLLWESGFMGTLYTVIREMKWNTGSVSLKQRRALMFTLCVFEVMMVLFLIQVFAPGSMLFSAFDTYENSALSQGIWGLVTVLIIILGNVYGYSSGKLVTKNDFVNAHTKHISLSAGYFITIFLAAELLACLKYIGLLSEEFTTVLSYILYYVPLAVHLTSSILSSSTYQTNPFTSR